MDTSALTVPSSPSSLSPFYSTSISNAATSISAASSSVFSDSTVSRTASASSSLSSSSPDIITSSLIHLCLSLSSIHCTTACVAASMPDLRPAHSCIFPHAVFAWYPAALITSYGRDRRSVSPISMGHTPGILSSATRRHAISAQ